MLASEMPSGPVSALVSATASLIAVAAPTPPDGGMTWMASPTSVTNGETSHSDRSGVDDITRSETAKVSSCSSIKHMAESLHSSVNIIASSLAVLKAKTLATVSSVNPRSLDGVSMDQYT